MGNLLKGDLGYSSFYKKDVKDCLSTPLLNTIQINIVSTILALAITIPLGIHCAVRKFSKFDNTVQVLTIVGYSMPQYIVALVFIFVFAVKLGWFPISGMNTPNFQGTGVAFVLDRLHYLALPVIVMTVAALGSMTRYVRAAMIDALRMDYIRTARAKGLKEKDCYLFPRMEKCTSSGHHTDHQLVHEYFHGFDRYRADFPVEWYR